MYANCCVSVQMAGNLYRHIDHVITVISYKMSKENGLCHSYDLTSISCVHLTPFWQWPPVDSHTICC